MEQSVPKGMDKGFAEFKPATDASTVRIAARKIKLQVAAHKK